MTSQFFRTVAELENLGEASLQTGPFGTQLKASEYVDEGIPVINVRNIGFGDVRKEDLEYLNEAKAEKLHQHRLRKGDIVFGRKGAVERHALIDESVDGWIQGSDCLRLRINSQDVCERYLSHYLKTQAHQDWMQALCSFGATMSSLNQDIVRRISFPAPPIEVQRKIAATLTAYDELIENNQRRIALLEKMAEEIYREWFVRMRFPGHEKVKVIKGVPEGWQRTKVATLTSYLKRGVAPQYDDLAEGIAINQKCIRDGKLDLNFARRQSRDVPADRQVRFGDVLVNSTGEGTLGRVAQVLVPLSNCIVDSHVTIVRPKPDVPIHYFGMTLKAWEVHFITMGRGATNQTELAPSVIGGVEITVPSKPLQEAFESHAEPLFAQITHLRDQNVRLVRTRDLLLPRLISGKLSVENLDIQFPPGMEDRP
ncbi:MAG: restriction endonuclease subunit S [Sulfuricella sp.]|jgi:type I restriction enzyme S subunit